MTKNITPKPTKLLAEAPKAKVASAIPSVMSQYLKSFNHASKLYIFSANTVSKHILKRYQDKIALPFLD